MIAYTSDLHIDFYLRDAQCTKLMFDKHFGKYFEKLSQGDLLIIAGDLGHYPEQNIKFLNILRNKYNLYDIVLVQGNHECYMVNDKQRRQFKTGLDKMEYQLDLYRTEGIKSLYGDTYEYTGIIIGGSNSFYDGSYFYQNGYNTPYSEQLLTYWKRYMNDHRYINIEDFCDYADSEKKKFRQLIDKPIDIMVSHMKPVIAEQYFTEEYQGVKGNTFYCFDFEEYILESKIKYWVYGHTHICEDYVLGNGTKLIANPYGYPSESKGKELKFINIGD